MKLQVESKKDLQQAIKTETAGELELELVAPISLHVGDPVITIPLHKVKAKDLIIRGNGHAVKSRNNGRPIFRITNAESVSYRRLEISGIRAAGGSRMIEAESRHGGGIQELEVADCVHFGASLGTGDRSTMYVDNVTDLKIRRVFSSNAAPRSIMRSHGLVYASFGVHDVTISDCWVEDARDFANIRAAGRILIRDSGGTRLFHGIDVFGKRDKVNTRHAAVEIRDVYLQVGRSAIRYGESSLLLDRVVATTWKAPEVDQDATRIFLWDWRAPARISDFAIELERCRYYGFDTGISFDSIAAATTATSPAGWWATLDGLEGLAYDNELEGYPPAPKAGFYDLWIREGEATSRGAELVREELINSGTLDSDPISPAEAEILTTLAEAARDTAKLAELRRRVRELSAKLDDYTGLVELLSVDLKRAAEESEEQDDG